METIILGGRNFELAPLPFAQLRRLTVATNRVGRALALGIADEETIDDMAKVLAIGLAISPEGLDALPTNWHECCNAFRALMRVSGMDQEIDFALGEAQRRGLIAKAPAALESIHGTGSTPESPPQLAGAGATSTR